MSHHADYMRRLHLDEAELQSRLAYFEIGQADLERLAAARPMAEAHMAEVVEGFYELIMAHPEPAAFMEDPDRVRRLKRAQSSYFLGLFSGVVDLDYVRDRLRVGFVHERIGLPL